MKKILDKYIIIKYVAGSYVKTLLSALVVFTAIFGALELSGIYSRMESALDLKYNSPFVLAPLYGFAGLSFLCFFIGFLMYFYKYKRTKTKSAFYRSISKILNEKDKNKRIKLNMFSGNGELQ